MGRSHMGTRVRRPSIESKQRATASDSVSVGRIGLVGAGTLQLVAAPSRSSRHGFLGHCQTKSACGGWGRSVASADAQSLPLLQELARGDPPHGDALHPLSALVAAGRGSSVRAGHRYLPRNGAILVATVFYAGCSRRKSVLLATIAFRTPRSLWARGYAGTAIARSRSTRPKRARRPPGPASGSSIGAVRAPISTGLCRAGKVRILLGMALNLLVAQSAARQDPNPM